MVSSFLTALLQFSDESVKKLAQAFDSTASTVTGKISSRIDGFTYGSLRFLFIEQDRLFLVLVVPRASDVDILRPLGDRIIEEFLTTYHNQDFSLPDVSVYETFEEEIDKILVSSIDLEPIEAEITYFQHLLEN
jgi:hypothetical protein